MINTPEFQLSLATLFIFYCLCTVKYLWSQQLYFVYIANLKNTYWNKLIPRLSHNSVCAAKMSYVDEASLNRDNIHKHLQEWREDCTPSLQEIKHVLTNGSCPPQGKSFIIRGKYNISMNLLDMADKCYWCGYLDCRSTMLVHCDMCKVVVCGDCNFDLGLYDRVCCVGSVSTNGLFCPRLGYTYPFDIWQHTGKITVCGYPRCVPCATFLLEIRRYSDNECTEGYKECCTKGISFCQRCAANYLTYNDCTWDAELEMLTCANKGCQSVELKIRNIIEERVKAFEWRPRKHAKMQKPYRSAMRALAILARAACI